MRVCHLVAPVVAVLLGLLAGCETTTIAEGPPRPVAQFGPAFEVVHAKRYQSSISGILDKNGRAHLIVAYPVDEPVVPGQNGEAPHQHVVFDVRHMVIGPHGVESVETVKRGLTLPVANSDGPDIPPVDIAFDSIGVLHAIVGQEHLVLRNGEWQGKQRTPWDELKLKPLQTGFVHQMPGLVWGFTVSNGDIGLPDEALDKPPPGPDGGPRYIEYRTYQRLLVTPEETPYRRFYAMPMEDTRAYAQLGLAVDAQQSIHFYYFGTNGLRYAVFGLDRPCPALPHATPEKPRYLAKVGRDIPVCEIMGSFVTAEDPPLAAPPQPLGPRVHIGPKKFHLLENGDTDTGFAMDPESGAVLITGGHIFSVLAGSGAPKSRLAKLPASNAGVLTAPAGDNRFHALMTGVEGLTLHPTLYYLAYSRGKWSAPVAIGTYSYHYIGAPEPTHIASDAFRIIGDGHGRALLLWPRDDTLRARWVTLK